MDRFAWDLHQIVSDLRTIPGALVIADGEDEPAGSSTNINDKNHSINHASAHRRALRRLDRTLQQLQEELQKQPPMIQAENPLDIIDDSSQDDENSRSHRPSTSNGLNLVEMASQHSTPSVPTTLPPDLLLLLTRLEIPTETNTGQLAASVFERLVPLWMETTVNDSSQHCLSEGDPAIMSLLQRLLDCRENNNHSSNDFLWTAALAWLRVLNRYFAVTLEQLEQRQEDGRGNANDEDEDETQATVDGLRPVSLSQPWVLVQVLQEFLRSSLNMVHATPWENVTDVAAEARVQWRILTGYLLERTVRAQQQQQQSESLERWLYCCYRCAAVDDESSVSEQSLLDLVQSLLSNMLLYLTDLSDYALDALDGAAITFTSSLRNAEKDPTTHQSATDELSQEQIEAFVSAENDVQDSLRHVTLAINLMEAIQPFCSARDASSGNDNDFAVRLEEVRRQQTIQLWVTMAPAFMEKSNVTTALNFKQRLAHFAKEKVEDDLGFRICHHRLHLAEMVLSRPLPQSTNDGKKSEYERTLCLTFLRGLDFPDMLLQAENLWRGIEERLLQSGNMELKRMIQVAVLTLRHQHMLPAVPASNAPRQRGAQAVVQRLLSLLTAAEEAKCNDPWDGFFTRQVAGLSIHDDVISEE